MGLFSKKKSAEAGQDVLSTNENMSTLDSTTKEPRKKSLYQKYQELKRGPGTSGLSDEDFKKYTGMDRVEFEKYKATEPGVAGGQAAGSLTAGVTSGITIADGAGAGFGGWGTEAGKQPTRR